MRDRQLQQHNHYMEELLNREKWLLQLAEQEVAQRKKDEKAMIEAAKAANDKKIAEEKAAAEDKAKLDASAYAFTQGEYKGKDALKAAQKQEEIAKSAIMIAAAKIKEKTA